ncbi:hypothetical protein Natpe_1834 [Natrinema pellirubrum DSM 15624]|uniref:Uncharacterized protein n=1 Tax=Natrinema pellirubrum (strain DSM 15624 / CIP 106293 / JCM 10476 / NCIMB 786 / 157) TaxID=797303 RepID=L0JJJ9_NATP1|nr:hypothetical protein [Natrinema pellirubrum]AGB31710.1 hypothetical protein Natpe_1834 [Natrinema pellirubrum DSM 15624]
MLDDESAIGAWESMVQELLGGIEYPIATVPDGEAALPEDSIYDSSRSYAENKARIDRYRASE